MSAERRRSIRSRALLRGLVVFNRGAMTTPCVVRDISIHGARIKLPKGTVVPDIFELHLTDRKEKYPCRLVRAYGEEVGVEFLNAAGEPLAMGPEFSGAHWPHVAQASAHPVSSPAPQMPVVPAPVMNTQQAAPEPPAPMAHMVAAVAPTLVPDENANTIWQMQMRITELEADNARMKRMLERLGLE